VSRSAGALALLLALAAAARPQAPSPSPSAAPQVFPGDVEQVTVDVVVVDKRGQPVDDLTKQDFVVLDEGRPRPLASFDLIRLPSSGSEAREAGPAPTRPRSATNLEPAEARGRQFVIVFDDVHMSPLNAQRAKAAVAEFLRHGTRTGDRATLVATGGGAWWTTRLPVGRPDLLAVLKHLDGRRIPESALERLTDHEAIRIFVYRDALVAARVLARFERYSARSTDELRRERSQQMQQLTPGVIEPYLEHRAAEAYLRYKTRLEVTLGMIERSLEALQDSRGRKAVLLVSEGFAYDPSIKAFKRVSEAARRANAALYFVDTRGLEALPSLYSAEFGLPVPEQDLMAAIADVSQEGEGAATLADQTGGFAVRNTNDFSAGAVRIGRESSSYYVLGYDPGEIPRDGRFRKIEVRVKRKDVTVRSRRGYHAPGADAEPGPSAAGRDAGIQRALDAPGALDAIPLRISAYVLDQAALGKARVVLAAESDVSKVAFAAGESGSVASLDTLLVVAHRDSGDFHRSDQRVELSRRSQAPGGPVWYAFAREFSLPAGAYQSKLIVRDAATQRVGSLIFEFEVPPLERLRVSTPILSDRLQKAPDGSATPVLLVARRFASGATLVCRFDVYGATPGPDGMPQVAAGYVVRRAGGGLFASSEPSLIAPTSLGALVRQIQLPLNARPGDYELVLTVQDRISGESRELVEPFSVTPAGRSSG
jgi:VWFA-related protein